MTFCLRTTQINKDKEKFASGEAKWISGGADNGHKKHKLWDFESSFDLAVRVVRIKISDSGDDSYYTICTNLDRSEFPPEKIKELYRLRWGIESSFRELKYALGLINFHARKEEFIQQEIFAHFLMYNFCERITMNTVVAQNENRKMVYVVNHTMAVYICLDYFRCQNKNFLPFPEDEIKRHILPIRDNRRDRRKTKIKSAVCFMYRIA